MKGDYYLLSTKLMDALAEFQCTARNALNGTAVTGLTL
jgi:hypothetical protein